MKDKEQKCFTNKYLRKKSIFVFKDLFIVIEILKALLFNDETIHLSIYIKQISQSLHQKST